MRTLLTEAIVDIVNIKQKQNNGFGISIVNLPNIDIDLFFDGLQKDRKLELFFLGHEQEQVESIKKVVSGYEGVTVQFTVHSVALASARFIQFLTRTASTLFPDPGNPPFQ